MTTKNIKDIPQAVPYAQAKRLFATVGRIWDLFDHSTETMYGSAEAQSQAFVTRMSRATSDFWIYETDATPIPTAASRMQVNYTEQRAPATDLDTASAGKLAYIQRRAKRKHLALVDYVEHSRRLISSRSEIRYSPITFSIHSLKRFWERNEQGVNATDFADIDLAHIPAGLIDIRHDAGPRLRTDVMVPYQSGAFIGAVVTKPDITWVFEDGKLDPAQCQQSFRLTFNAITYVGDSRLSAFQKRMRDHILAGEHDKYRQLLLKDIKASAVILQPQGLR